LKGQVVSLLVPKVLYYVYIEERGNVYNFVGEP